MEEEEARDFDEPCAKCISVDWGVTDEGKFYCRSCHTVTERTREVVTGDVVSNARAQSLCRGLKKRRKFDKGWEWYICEGFQYILQKQGEALQSLGVSSHIKDEVLYNLWRRYLQKSKQAFCNKPVTRSGFTSGILSSTDTEAETELDIPEILRLASSASDTDIDGASCVTGGSSTSKMSGTSAWSGSVDGTLYLQRCKKGDMRMSMPMTLAFCSLALLWLRESITLSDLLRFVMDGYIPYLNAYKDFPEEMKVYGADFKVFNVRSWPAYDDVHKKMHALAKYIELPCFPDISESCFLHPNILCMKYLMEVNLPDDMHNWTCTVIKKTGIGEIDFLKFQPGKKSSERVKYDILAVATVIVVLKILFFLDDKYEWQLADIAKEKNKDNKEGPPVFDIEKWYGVIKNTLDIEQKKFNEERIRRLWKCEKPVLFSAAKKYIVHKRHQMVVDLQKQFRTLSGSTPPPEKQKPSAFQLNWTEESTDKTYFYKHSLAGILPQKCFVFPALNKNYWLGTTKLCTMGCGHFAHFKESDFPHTYRFVLNLFSFLLRVQPSLIHEEVCVLEHKLFNSRLSLKTTVFKTSRK
ncbi:TATA box-binding protein-associated factor RNA polymerase I subunit B [Anolis carolinensis]|nr:PREDICTED: TATA box-binding protein-associated factor RNA polymerase I subunit B [Anolis carolinensis]|eukprot:XP_008115812.2 PREDICTED: TATA box-binding protein-associated factor RNA polymerase I subunit B [Anolis carolinensis]